MRAALHAAVQNRARRVIPVLLPGAPDTSLPSFLALYTWVDLRGVAGDGREPPDAFHRLVSGIRGVAPGRGPAASGRGNAAPTAPPPPAAISGPSLGELRVFLCHAPDDKPAVRALYERLLADGAAPWLDEEKILPGQNRRLEISRAVRAAHAVVVCLSQHTSVAGSFHREMRLALDVAEEQPEDAIFILPLRLEACEVPDRLEGKEPVNLYAARGYERLVRALRARADSLGLAG
jgi:hypothetical protein